MRWVVKVVLILLILLISISWERKRRRCSELVTAMVVDTIENEKGLVKPLFQYIDTRGRHLIVNARYKKKTKLNKYDYINLYINPIDDNEFIYEDRSRSGGLVRVIIIIVIGVLIWI